MKAFLYQFCRLFWPKEMKELVDKYQAEGTLNEAAVMHFNITILKICAIIAVCSLVILLLEPVLLSIFLILTIILIVFGGGSIYKGLYLPYIKGTKQIVTVKYFGRNLQNDQYVSFFHHTLPQPHKGGFWLRGNVKLLHSDCPKPGSDFPIYYLSIGNSLVAMPDISYIKRKYSLNATILEN